MTGHELLLRDKRACNSVDLFCGHIRGLTIISGIRFVVALHMNATNRKNASKPQKPHSSLDKKGREGKA